MSITEQITKEIIVAMKAKDADRLSALRMIKTALKLRETEIPGGMDEGEEIKVLQKLLNQRRDSAEQFRAGGREDRALKEEQEAKVIEAYLPSMPSAGELLAVVEASIAESGAKTQKDMGTVIKLARSKLEGKPLDGKALSDLVKSKLA
ncbi:MAG TPA: GatB/YqeY domain-containing protein [Blastocatellia bacterium]|nr:GatB/YqeY domain-containing protein [Blastocatellia bacterium]